MLLRTEVLLVEHSLLALLIAKHSGNRLVALMKAASSVLLRDHRVDTILICHKGCSRLVDCVLDALLNVALYLICVACVDPSIAKSLQSTGLRSSVSVDALSRSHSRSIRARLS